MKRWWWILFCILWLKGSWASPLLELDLKTAENNAVLHSERLEAIRAEYESAENREFSQWGLLFPKLSLEASYRYVSEVATIQLPGGMSSPMGDHHNYSVGPQLLWTAYDGGMLRNQWKGARALRMAKHEEKMATELIVRQQVRFAYFRVALALEQLKMVADSLKLAQAQHRDIINRQRAGASSRIDAISAHREVLNLRLQFRSTQSELAINLRDLLALTHSHSDLNIDSPMEESLISQLPDEVASPTVTLRWEALSNLLQKFKEVGDWSENHPQLIALDKQREALRLTGESLEGGLYPRLLLSAKASYDYPNGPVLERIQQNTVMATLSFPLFEFSKTRKEAAEKFNLSLSAEKKKELATVELRRDYDKARDLLRGYEAQREIMKKSVEESAELAKLIYSSYRSGRANFLEVQSANLKVLETRVQYARNDVQILIQRAQLETLAPASRSFE